MGTAADMMIQPWGALVVGSLAGVLSVIGFNYITVIFTLTGVNYFTRCPTFVLSVFMSDTFITPLHIIACENVCR